jgi:hypothetical protein
MEETEDLIMRNHRAIMENAHLLSDQEREDYLKVMGYLEQIPELPKE